MELGENSSKPDSFITIIKIHQVDLNYVDCKLTDRQRVVPLSSSRENKMEKEKTIEKGHTSCSVCGRVPFI